MFEKLIAWLNTAKTEVVIFLGVASPFLSQYFGIDINAETVGGMIDSVIQSLSGLGTAVGLLAAFVVRTWKKQPPPV